MTTVITNNVPREILDAWELTPAQREDFDYLDWAAIERGEDSATFVQYRGELYDLNDICEASWGGGMPESLRGWDNYASDSFFSGVVVRYVHEDDDYRVVMGRYYS